MLNLEISLSWCIVCLELVLDTTKAVMTSTSDLLEAIKKREGNSVQPFHSKNQS